MYLKKNKLFYKKKWSKFYFFCFNNFLVGCSKAVLKKYEPSKQTQSRDIAMRSRALAHNIKQKKSRKSRKSKILELLNKPVMYLKKNKLFYKSKLVKFYFFYFLMHFNNIWTKYDNIK